MKRLIISDLHLTDKPLDVYRWGIFKWLKKVILENKVDRLYILGDLTHRKNHHSSFLVNRIVHELFDISKHIEIIILKGNHDYVDEDEPFYHFLSVYPNIHFYKDIYFQDKELFLPHTNRDLDKWNTYNFDDYDFVYLHQALIWAKLENKYSLKEGLDIQDFKDFKDTMFISGDIHKPQVMGDNFIYTGSPYPINFGDDFTGRALLIDDKNNIKEIPYETIKKHKINIRKIKELDDYELTKDDQVNIEVNLLKSELHEFFQYKKQIKEYCKEKQVYLHSVTMKIIEGRRRLKKKISNGIKKDAINDDETLSNYCKTEELGQTYLDIGNEIIGGSA